MDAASAKNSVGSSPRCESMTVDFESLFAGLSLPPRGDGYTTAEIMAATRMGREKARDKIKQALAAGVCSRSEKHIERMDGRMTRVTSYVFKVQEE